MHYKTKNFKLLNKIKMSLLVIGELGEVLKVEQTSEYFILKHFISCLSKE